MLVELSDETIRKMVIKDLDSMLITLQDDLDQVNETGEAIGIVSFDNIDEEREYLEKTISSFQNVLRFYGK